MATEVTDKRLPESFYLREGVVEISRDLLGKLLVTNFEGERTKARIVETEAYRGPDDKACHAYGFRRTKRTEIMFGKGGQAYVYLCYGIHHLFNVVTGPAEKPHAVLVRAVEPLENLDAMLRRRSFSKVRPQLTAGPGVLTKALGITTAHTGMSLVNSDSNIWIEDLTETLKPEEIIASPRVGVDYAQECALWPWRFRIRHNKWTSPVK